MSLFGIEIPQAVFASLLAALFAIAGTLTVVARDSWARQNRVYFTAFAAGILLTTGIMLLPEVFKATPHAPLFVLAGYLALYIVNVSFSRRAGAAIAPLVAIGLHSFLDGFEYGVLFNHDPHTGWIASAGLIAHEFAEGVILYTFLRTAKLNVGLSIAGAIMGAALTTPLGAITSQVALGSLSTEIIGMLLAGAAGALIYLGATHLPSHDAHRARHPLAVTVFLAGVLLAVGLSTVHTHEVEHVVAETEDHAAH